MTKLNRALPNQSLLDMILTEYGSLEAGMAVAAANNVDISHVPLTGTVKKMPVVSQVSVDVENADYIRKNDVVIGTLALPKLGFAIVLRPLVHVVPNITGDPHALGYYSFDLIEAPGFSHINPLADTYLSDNRLYYESEERYVLGHPNESSLPLSITPMPVISIPYKLIWTVGFGYMLVWSDLSQPIDTVTYKDAEGNQAFYAPVTALDNVSMDVIEHFMGDITVDVVTATSSYITLRLTRSHPPIGLSNFSDHTMEWLEEATSGSPDPLDPSNPDKTILTLVAGTYTIGMKTRYFFPGGSPEYPSSAFSMVIKVL